MRTFSLKIIRKKITINGIVQGVGFRPFVHFLASEYQLTGFVRNNSQGVEIQVQGEEKSVALFIRELPLKIPPAAMILEINSSDIDVSVEEDSFQIIPSSGGEDMDTLISPDLALCEDCKREMLDPENRRYLYPFTNCTNCGPRFTIIKNIPYDRPATTMADFKMCATCQKEYDDPKNRRYHAQPNACSDCGPQVVLKIDSDLSKHGNDAFREAAQMILDGKILAIKGLGGFHLAVNANDDQAVKRLRERKKRDQKAFAVMVENVSEASKIVKLTEKESSLLQSPSSPILIAKRKHVKIPVESIAPGNPTIGIMIAYTPLHIVLFHFLKKSCKEPLLVMTSANYSEEPIVITNEDAESTLDGLADAFLFHNRDILLRADDSVVQIVNEKTLFLRRSRGVVPVPLIVNSKGINNNTGRSPAVSSSYDTGCYSSILAVGAELKNTIAILKKDQLFLSSHIGDLTNLKAYEFFQESIGHLKTILKTDPEIIACDRHPSYLSTQWVKNLLSEALAEGRDKKIYRIQHHHAHMAACMAENKIDKDVIAIILDGTGLGFDGKIWGGEIFSGNFTHFKREASLQLMPLPGGDAAVKEPWKMALAYLLECGLSEHELFADHNDADIIRQMWHKKINTPYTSSCGRLFDAASVIAGGREKIFYEAQAAIEFMNQVDINCQDSYKLPPNDKGVINIQALLSALLYDRHAGTDISVLAARFHNSLADLLTEQALRIRKNRQLNDIVLSGGVFQNKILFTRLSNNLYYNKFRVWSHEALPANDGSISAGQAVVAEALHNKGLQDVDFEDLLNKK